MLVSVDDGSATTYSLALIEPRGILFISPQEKVYEVWGEGQRAAVSASNPYLGLTRRDGVWGERGGHRA